MWARQVNHEGVFELAVHRLLHVEVLVFSVFEPPLQNLFPVWPAGNFVHPLAVVIAADARSADACFPARYAGSGSRNQTARSSRRYPACGLAKIYQQQRPVAHARL